MKYAFVFGDFRFECFSRETRTGFRYVCNMYHNNTYVHDTRINYYNSTSEQYAFQSVMLRCVRELMEFLEKVKLRQMKEENGWGKMTANRWSDLKDELSADSNYIYLCQLATRINNADYDEKI